MKEALLLAFVLVAACDNKPSLGQIQKDGFQCTRTGSKGGFKPTPGSHCFVCPDDTSMSKCGANPLTSGCTEDAKACGP